MTIAGVVNFTLRGISRTICEIDDTELKRIPAEGPLILAGNHVNFLDAPILLSHLQPRKVVPLVKVETWQNPVIGMLFNQWDSIAIHRGEADMGAFREALRVLKEGKILVIAPEGTRSGNGQLLKGQPGIVPLAIKSGAPILPIASFGSEVFWHNIKGFSRTPFTMRVGRPFRLKYEGTLPSREEREIMTAEIMYRIAALLPAEYRGYYADLQNATQKYLEFTAD